MSDNNILTNSVLSIYARAKAVGLLENRLSQSIFLRSYFLYKKYFEDSLQALANKQPSLFSNGSVLDIGANIGYTASIFAKHIDSDSHVFAFEPEPWNFSLLQRSLALQKIDQRVTPVQYAIGATDAETQLVVNPIHHGDHHLSLHNKEKTLAEETITVQVRSVDSFVSEHNLLDSLSLIKIDVQGYEFEVCKGMEKTLAAKPDISVILEYSPKDLARFGVDPAVIFTYFTSAGFRAYKVERDGNISSVDFENLNKKLSGPFSYCDILFSRKSLG